MGFYVHGFFCIGNAHEGVKYYDQLRGWQDSRLTYDECAENIKFVTRPDVKLKESELEPITEIRIGDFIHKSELDTEEKYNDVVRVFESFGFKSDGSNFVMLNLLNEVVNVNADEGGRLYCGIFLSPSCGINRQLTYDQIMSLDKVEHIDVDNCNVDKMVSMEPCKVKDADKTSAADQVKSPSHYQLIEGVESIEIIARSMTQAEWKGFCLGNMLKYRIRAGKKDSLQQDIDKANFYSELYEMHKGKCYDA